MDLNKKIEHILLAKNISPSQFADEVGVTRSGISHILTGRNRPSLDLVQKIIARYPELGTSWILDGEPLPVLDQNGLADFTTGKNPTSKKDKIAGYSRRDELVTSKNVESRDIKLPENKQVASVMIFYTDGSFKEYSPA